MNIPDKQTKCTKDIIPIFPKLPPPTPSKELCSTKNTICKSSLPWDARTGTRCTKAQSYRDEYGGKHVCDCVWGTYLLTILTAWHVTPLALPRVYTDIGSIINMGSEHLPSESTWAGRWQEEQALRGLCWGWAAFQPYVAGAALKTNSQWPWWPP